MPFFFLPCCRQKPSTFTFVRRAHPKKKMKGATTEGDAWGGGRWDAAAAPTPPLISAASAAKEARAAAAPAGAVAVNSAPSRSFHHNRGLLRQQRNRNLIAALAKVAVVASLVAIATTPVVTVEAFSVNPNEAVELLKVPATCAALNLTSSNITLPASNSTLRDLTVNADGGAAPPPPPPPPTLLLYHTPFLLFWHFFYGEKIWFFFFFFSRGNNLNPGGASPADAPIPWALFCSRVERGLR